MVRTALLFALLVLGSIAAHAQLKVGDGGLIGYHSDFRKRPLYFTGAVGAGYSRSVGRGTQVTGGLSGGVGYAYQISEPFRLGAEAWAGSGVRFRGSENPNGALDATSVSAGLKMTAFFTAGKKGRSWLKVSVPLYTTRNILDWDEHSYGSQVSSASIAWIYLFKQRPEYVRPTKVRGKTGGFGLRKGFSYDLRVGSTYLATSFAPRINYTWNRWEIGLGTLIHGGQAGGIDEGLALVKDYFPLTTSLGYTLRRTEHSRLQLLGEVLLPLGRSEADRFAWQRTYVSLYARYEHQIDDRLSVAVEIGPNYMRNARGGAVDINGFLHGTVGVRYRLGK